jgi:Peptidase A4 family
LTAGRSITIALAAAGTALALGAGGARATTNPSLRFDTATNTSANWAGYAVQSGDPAMGAVPTTFTNVSGSWTQPATTCAPGSPTYSAFWLGLGGFADGSQALEQTGTAADCNVFGTPVYYVWYELVPAAPVTVKLAVKPGDAFTASVTANGTTISLRIVNTTRRKVFTKKLPMAVPDLSSAEWIAEAPSTCSNFGCRALSLANFGTVSFSGAVATGNGHVGTISDPAWAATEVTLQGAGPDPGRFGGRFMNAITIADAFPGALSPDGLAFDVAWQQQTTPPDQPPSDPTTPVQTPTA